MVAQVNQEPLHHLKRIFGGSVTRRNRAKASAGKWNDIYSWQATGSNAVLAVHAMWPYLSQRRRDQIDKVRARIVADKLDYDEWKETVGSSHRHVA